MNLELRNSGKMGNHRGKIREPKSFAHVTKRQQALYQERESLTKVGGRRDNTVSGGPSDLIPAEPCRSSFIPEFLSSILTCISALSFIFDPKGGLL
jgi:hypothetical protein